MYKETIVLGKIIMKNKFKSLLPIIIVTIITAFVSIGAYYNLLHKEYDKCNQILIDSSESMSQEIRIRFEDNINLLNILAKRIQREGIINSKDNIINLIHDAGATSVFREFMLYIRTIRFFFRTVLYTFLMTKSHLMTSQRA